MTLKYVAAIWIAFTAIFGILFTQARSASINDTKTLLNDLLAEYDTDVRPVMDQFSAVNVSVTAYIKSIQEFDEVQEKFSFVGALFLGWEDANMKWNANEYGGVNTISVSYERVWVPELVLSSPSDDVSTLGQSWNKIRYYSNGFAIWVPVDLIESTCAVNVKNYPFDTQVCITSFSTIGYDTSEVLLRTAKTEFDLSIYQENSLWRIVKTKVSVQIVGGLSQLILSITLKRKPSFVIVNLVLPILFMSLLNVLVFLLVPESGERVSYCVTVLLAIAVFMTIVSDLLPRSSEPVPVISYKLMTDMIISSLIVLVTILNLRLYNKNKDDLVPIWLQKLYNCLSCKICKTTRIFRLRNRKTEETPSKIKTMILNEDATAESENKTKLHHLCEEIEKADTMTWKQISLMVDWMSFVMFTLASVISFLAFLVATLND